MTQKNFMNLPEVRQKKIDELRQKELQSRKELVQAYAKEMDKRRREQLRNKCGSKLRGSTQTGSSQTESQR